MAELKVDPDVYVAISSFIELSVTANQVQGNLLDAAKSSFTHTWANYAQFATIQ